MCLEHLQNQIKKNVDALMVSMTKRSAENESIEKSSNTVEDDLSDAEEVRDEIEITASLLEHEKQSFTQL